MKHNKFRNFFALWIASICSIIWSAVITPFPQRMVHAHYSGSWQSIASQIGYTVTHLAVLVVIFLIVRKEWSTKATKLFTFFPFTPFQVVIVAVLAYSYLSLIALRDTRTMIGLGQYVQYDVFSFKRPFDPSLFSALLPIWVRYYYVLLSYAIGASMILIPASAVAILRSIASTNDNND